MLRRDWRLFVRDFLGVSGLWAKQCEIMDSVWHNRYTAVKTGHGIGKTYAAAALVLAFLYCWSPAQVVCTAPTWWQAEKLLWKEVLAMHGRARVPLGGDVKTAEIKLSESWWAAIRSTNKSDNFQGIHAKNILLVADEAAGIPETIYEAMMTGMTGGNARLLLIGNPTNVAGTFHKAFSSPAWSTITISCFDHPNVVEGSEIVPGAVTREWIEDRRADWEGTPIWKPRVLGEFPDQAEDQLISVEWIERAASRVPAPRRQRVVAIGCDVARYGGDETVIYVIADGAIIERVVFRGKNLMETAGRLKHLAEKHGAEIIGVDDTGLGGGVTDRLREQDMRVLAVSFGASPDDTEKYADMPSELWGELAEGFKHGLIGPLVRCNEDGQPLEKDEPLVGQLSARKYTFTSAGQIKIESKKEVKKRGLHSPDRGDGLAVAWRAYRTAEGTRPSAKGLRVSWL